MYFICILILDSNRFRFERNWFEFELKIIKYLVRFKWLEFGEFKFDLKMKMFRFRNNVCYGIVYCIENCYCRIELFDCKIFVVIVYRLCYR